MQLQFFGGPYDGLMLTLDQIAVCAWEVIVRSGGEYRGFALMPPLAEWERLAAGEWSPDDLFGGYAYELLLRPGALPEYRDAVLDRGFETALAEGWVI
jgi:hypothetical protein